ncbi:MAG TPA: SurA N-terminal domain-containing protein [Vicinamibacteria bacterium]|nr:SurA N-terminal domain-containing protein [Vicinamibacteria bacterium]
MALGFMRRHRRWLFVFLWLVIGAFVLTFNIPAFQEAGSPGETVAEVGGRPITLGEFQRAYLRQRQQMQRLYGDQLDPAMLARLGLDEQVLSSLVEQRLVRLEAERLGLSVDDDALARSIEASPMFQQNGRFVGGQEIKRLLDLQGISVREFEDSYREQLLAERLESLVTDGVAVSQGEAEREFRRRTEQVRAEYALVSADKYAPEIGVTDAEVKAAYDSRREEFRVPEKRVVSYLLVDAAALRARAAVTDAEIGAYYQARRDELTEPEQACTSHILVKVKATPEAAEGHPEEEARRLAQQALAQVKAGADFADIARKVSEDAGSASAGGDLGCSPRGRMVPEFDNAAFSLDPGQVSDLVRTGFGFHVIRLDSRKEETVPALAQVKEGIRQTLVAQKASALVADKVQAISRALAGGRRLEDVGRIEGLAVQKSAPFARGERPPVLDSPLLVARAFELERGEVASEPLAVGAGQAFVGLPEIQPAKLPELAEVQDKVKAALVEERAMERAREAAAALRARAGREGLEKAAAALGAVRKETPSLVGRGQPLGDLGTSRGLEEAAFTLPEKAVSEPVRAPGGYAVLRVLERKPFDPAAFESQKDQIAHELKQQKRGQLFRAYLSKARERYTIERRPDALQRVLG